MTHTSCTVDSFPGPQPTGDGVEHRCQWDGCKEPGKHRAPIDRTLSEYYVFCLDHVRAYNAQWNYHDGMSPDDMEREYRRAATCDRPTWKFGERQAPGRPWHQVFDPFDVFHGAQDKESRRQSAPQDMGNGEADARRVLGLSGPVTITELKSRYKELVKRFHPDANGGAEEAENRMKAINAAYQTLRSILTP